MGRAASKLDAPELRGCSRDTQDGQMAANADQPKSANESNPTNAPTGGLSLAATHLTYSKARPQPSRANQRERNKCRPVQGCPPVAMRARRLARAELQAAADMADLSSMWSSSSSSTAAQSPSPSLSSRSSAAQSSCSSALLISPLAGEIPIVAASDCCRTDTSANICSCACATNAAAAVLVDVNPTRRSSGDQSCARVDGAAGRQPIKAQRKTDRLSAGDILDDLSGERQQTPVQQVNFARLIADERKLQLFSESERRQQQLQQPILPKRHRQITSVSSLFGSERINANNNNNSNNNDSQIAFTIADTNNVCSTLTTCQQLPTRARQHLSEALQSSTASPLANKSSWNHMDWKGIALRYGRRPRDAAGQHERLWWRLRHSFACHALLGSIHGLFPILASFKDYSLPSNLLGDILAGFTIAVLHIPQGMAYGLLAGVEPIYGLYTSFIPVIAMALMSKSRHVSYGTFAIVSMLLANAIESFKQTMAKQQQLALAKPAEPPEVGAAALVIADNHQPAQLNLERQLLIRSLLTGASPDDNRLTGGQLEPLMGSLLPPTTTTAAPTTIPDTAGHLWSSDLQMGADFVMPTNIEILTAICLLVGLIQLLMSLARLGVFSLMFSDQLVSGFTTASAIHVVTSQIGALFDLNTPQVPEGLFRVCRVWWVFGDQLLDGFNHYTALLSLISILFLLSVKELLEPKLRRKFKSLTCLPSELILMSFLIFASWYWQFNANFDIRIIGNVPTGLPKPQLPRLDFAPLLIQDALTVALLSFAMNLSLAQVYAKKYKYTIDPNQELFAMGTANMVGSFFSCFPCASSLSRSAVQSSLNAKSQVSSLISCAIVVSIICYFAPILHDLPKSTLSCIIIVALKGILVQIKDLYENWRLSKLDALVWLTTFMSVIALGVTYGLILGMVASLFTVFFRLLTPNHSILGQLPGTDIFVDRDAFMNCNEVEGVKIFRFNSALCYLNRTMFKSSVEESLPSVYKKNGFSLFCSNWRQANNSDSDKVKFLVIDCSGLAYCDYSGAATLVDIIEELEEHKLTVYLAACPLKLINMIEKMQKTEVLERSVYPTIADAISQARYLRCFPAVPFEQTTSCRPVQSNCLQSVLAGDL